MSEYDNLLRILLEYENILEETLEKEKHIKDLHERMFTFFLCKTSNKDWNDKIIDIIKKLDNDFKNNIKIYNKDYLLSIRFLMQIYKQNYYRIDSLDINKLIDDQDKLEYDYYKKINDNMRDFVNKSLESTKLIIESIIKRAENDKKELYYTLGNNIFYDDVTKIINLTYEEVIIDYFNSCYISAISLCGKIIETAISELYKKVFSKYPDEVKDDLGFDKLVNQLRQKKYDLSLVKHQTKVISMHRNKAIHGNIITPTQDEAKGVILLTRNVLKIISSFQLAEQNFCDNT